MTDNNMITSKVKYENHMLPFFWQHGEDEATLRQYVGVIQDAGCEAFCVESRPHPDFCGPKWWQDMDAILDEASKRNMKVWILDDSHFPTGYANGAVIDADPALYRRSVMTRKFSYTGRAKRIALKTRQLMKPVKLEMTMMQKMMMTGSAKGVKDRQDDRILSVAAYGPNGQCMDLTGQDFFEKPEGDWQVYATVISANYGPHRNYINMMNQDSCKLLIQAVYEPHLQHYEKYFDNTIAGFFSDEPELGNGILYAQHNVLGTQQDLPWSEPLGQMLAETWGQDYKQCMPLLWENGYNQEMTQKFRVCYMDAVTKLVKDCFSYQVGDWCRAHGVQYIGHMIEDSDTHCTTGSGLGHYFRGLEGQDMAGIDDIGGQVLPQGEELVTTDIMGRERNAGFYHYTLAKLAQSLAALDPQKKGQAMCEIFGNYGWSSGVYEQKYLADHFLVRGINNYVPHAFSPKDFPDSDCPPHFYAHGNNPQYRAFGQLCRYMNRVASLLSGGKPVVPVAIYYHAESDWAGACQTLDLPARAVYEAGVDYLFLPLDYMEKAGEFKYVIVPKADYAPIQLAGLDNVLFVDELPGNYTTDSLQQLEGNASLETLKEKVVSLSQLGTFLAKNNCQDAKLQPQGDRVRILHYEGAEKVFFLVNEGVTTYHGKLMLPGNVSEYTGTPVIYDPWNETFVSVDWLQEENSMDITLESRKSLAIIITEEAQQLIASHSSQVSHVIKQGTTVTLTEFTRSTCKALDYPSFSGSKLVSLPDDVQQEEKNFGGFIRYEADFQATAGQQVVVAIEEAAEAIEVFVNGNSAGYQITPGYYFDVTPFLQEGENHLVIEQATTLGLSAGSGKMEQRMRGAAHAITGLSGTVKLYTLA